MDDEKLKKEIMNQFPNELKELGVTDIKLERRDTLPEETELARTSCCLDLLGKVGKNFVWVVRCAVGVVTLFVTLAILPDAYDRFKVNYPDTYQVVLDIGEHLKRKEIPVQDQEMVENSIKSNIDSKYIAFDQEWILNEDLYNQDMEKLEQDRRILTGDRTITLFPSSGSPFYISDSSSAATAYVFDIKNSDDIDKKV